LTTESIHLARVRLIVITNGTQRYHTITAGTHNINQIVILQEDVRHTRQQTIIERMTPRQSNYFELSQGYIIYCAPNTYIYNKNTRAMKNNQGWD